MIRAAVATIIPDRKTFGVSPDEHPFLFTYTGTTNS